MKRVCHLTSVHSSDDTRVFHKECVSLARAGYDVTLVAPGESREELGMHIVGVGEKPVGTLNRLTSPFVKRAYEAALALDCELYHLHDPELLPYALKLKRHGKTVIFDSHEFYSLLIQEKGYIPGFLKKPASRIYGALEAGVFKKLDAVIIPCTSFGKNPFEKCAKRTVIVDNLPDAGRFPPPEKLYPDAENTVGYVGGVTAERGITNLIGAAASGRSRLAGVSRRAEENAGVCVRGLCRCRSVCRGAGILPSFFRRLRNAFKYPPVRLHRQSAHQGL